MGVDGIGSGGRPASGVVPGEVSAAHGAAASEATEAQAASGASGSAALQRLQRGEIDLDRYLDARVDDAVKHLEGRMSGEQIDFVRQSLREQLASDPVLVELVRRTTGAIPSQVE
jgi:hypothetical protein